MKEIKAKINQTKSWFFEKVNKINKPLVRPSRKIGRKINSINLCKRSVHNRQHRNTKDHKKIL